MVAARYQSQRPAQIKRVVSNVKHFSAPLKGLSLTSKLSTGDPLTAIVLDNFVVEDNLIRARPGTRLQWSYSDATKSVETLVPYYGVIDRVAAAIDGKLVTLDNFVLKSGALSNDWSYTAFSNLSSVDYTVMCNGVDGVWSWDGTNTAITKEAITAPAGETWVVPDQFNIVWSHMNRLWFADSTNLAVYYLPLQQKSGAVKVWPLNALFKRGGTIRAMYTWTTDGALNLNDQLVVFSSNGEAVILTGVDPDSDMYVSGVYRFDSPMTKHSVVNYGGDLFVLINTGLVPMSTLMRAESEQLGSADKNIVTLFRELSINNRDRAGWEVFINPSSGRIYCNVPTGGENRYRQVIRNMPNPVWATWSNLPARCWQWINDRVFFGSDDGKVYELHPNYLNDNGQPIRIDVQWAWGNFGTPAIKQFKMVLPYIQSDGTPRPFIDIKVDYDMSPPVNQPDVTSVADLGVDWDLADWDVDGWAGGMSNFSSWSGVGRLGHVGAPRLTALVSNAEFAITGIDVLYETGSVFG